MDGCLRWTEFAENYQISLISRSDKDNDQRILNSATNDRVCSQIFFRTGFSNSSLPSMITSKPGRGSSITHQPGELLCCTRHGYRLYFSKCLNDTSYNGFSQKVSAEEFSQTCSRHCFVVRVSVLPRNRRQSALLNRDSVHWMSISRYKMIIIIKSQK